MKWSGMMMRYPKSEELRLGLCALAEFEAVEVVGCAVVVGRGRGGSGLRGQRWWQRDAGPPGDGDTVVLHAAALLDDQRHRRIYST